MVSPTFDDTGHDDLSTVPRRNVVAVGFWKIHQILHHSCEGIKVVMVGVSVVEIQSLLHSLPTLGNSAVVPG